MMGAEVREAHTPAVVRPAARDAGLIAVPAADEHACGILPPLNVTEDGDRRGRCGGSMRRRGGRVRGMRHFLDLDQAAAAELRASSTTRAMKAARAAARRRARPTPSGRWPGGWSR